MASDRDTTVRQFVVLTFCASAGLPHDGRHLEAASAEGLDGEIEVYEAGRGQSQRVLEIKKGRDLCSVHIVHHGSGPIHAGHGFAAADPVPVAAVLELEPTTVKETLAFSHEIKVTATGNAHEPT